MRSRATDDTSLAGESLWMGRAARRRGKAAAMLKMRQAIMYGYCGAAFKASRPARSEILMRRKCLRPDGCSVRVINPASNQPLLRAMPGGRPPAFPQYFPHPLHADRMPRSERLHHLPSGIFRVSLPYCGNPNAYGGPAVKLPFGRNPHLEVLIGGTPTLSEQSQHRRCTQR
jgi:hypothetical protein